MSPIAMAERGLLPDPLIRFGIRRLNRRRLRNEQANNSNEWQRRFSERLEQLRSSPIALETDAANEQHYEVPADFYRLCLGQHLKYSSGYWPEGTSSLDEAEAAMLQLSSDHAALADGQQVLELGCGWGSLTLWMAQHYPNSQITAVSNSASQRRYIMDQAEARDLSNVQVITADVNAFDIDEGRFDRVVSVEMFEHMRNYQVLMGNIARWLKPGGMLFVHIFCHRHVMYPFEVQGADDWMSQYFFTGGLMPAYDTLTHFQDELTLMERWAIDGTHYEKTANAWLAKMDQNRDQILRVFDASYDNAALWFQRWRIFYMACAELFGHKGGEEWLVGHYRFSKP